MAMTFQHSFHSPKNYVWWLSSLAWKIAWTGWLLQALSLLPGWPDQQMVFLDWGDTCHIAPYMPKRDPVGSLYVHCDLAADAHAVGNVRNCLSHAVPVEGHSCQVMCYKPWWLDWLDWLPMCWTELKDVHLLMMNSHDQKVPCEGGGVLIKLLTRQRANTFRSERERERERHGNVHHTVRKCLVPAGPWPQQCRLWDVPHGHSFAQGPGAVGWHVPSRWCAQGEEHGVDFQEPRHPFGGEPHAACRHEGWPSQEVHSSSQVTQVPGHLQAGPQATLPWRHLRLIRCATSECLMPDWSGCHFRLTHNSPVCHAPRANWTRRACCHCRLAWPMYTWCRPAPSWDLMAVGPWSSRSFPVVMTTRT